MAGKKTLLMHILVVDRPKKRGFLRKFNNAVKKMDFFFRIFSFGVKDLKKPCCTNRLLSVLWAPIEIPCYFDPNLSRFFGCNFFYENNMGCQWELIN